MIKIVAVILTYNSADTILDCLKSVDGKVDEIHCYDGRWEGFPYPSDHSDDDTQNLILKFAMTAKSTIYFISLPIMHQHEARTESMSRVENGDWIFTLDADEFVKIWDGKVIRELIEETTERGFKICCRYPKVYAAYPTYRFFYKTPNIHFSTDHRRIFDENGEVDLAHFNVTTAIVIDHLSTAITKRMRSYMEEYKKWLFNYEKSHPIVP
jgi:WD40 repeat protein